MDAYPVLPCHHCSTPLAVNSELFKSYIFTDDKNCPHCGAINYLWNSSLKALKSNFFPSHTLTLLGGILKIFKIYLSVNQTINLKLIEHGIPEHAYIININFTPEGSDLFPICILNDNNLKPILKIPKELYLYGMPANLSNSPENIADIKTIINVSVSYSTHLEDEDILNRLYSALVCFLDNDYGLMGLEAHSAIEQLLNNVISEFEKAMGVSNLKMKYHSNLTIRLNEICKHYNIQKIGDDFIRSLDLLYTNIRNQRAHETKPVIISKEHAAKYLCTTIFVFHYLSKIRKIISSHPASE